MSTVRQHLGLLWLERRALGVSNPQYDRIWAMQAALFVETHLDELIALAGGADIEGWAGERYAPIPADFPRVSATLPETTAPTGQAENASNLRVWYGAMPESNGKSNFTAILHAGDIEDGLTLARSEYPDRVRYEADRARYLIGELKERPFILDYDADKRSDYAAPAIPTVDRNAVTMESAINALQHLGVNNSPGRFADAKGLLKSAPASVPQPAAQVAVSGMHEAADFIDRRAQKYLDENADTEFDTGAVVFHHGEAGRDYHSTLVELADDLRATPATVKTAEGE